MKTKIIYAICIVVPILLLGGCLGFLWSLDNQSQEELLLTFRPDEGETPRYRPLAKTPNLLEGKPLIVTESFQFKLVRLYANTEDVCVVANVKTNNDIDRAIDLYDLQIMLNHQLNGQTINSLANAQEVSWIECFVAPNSSSLTILIGDLDGDLTGESAEFTIYK